jgi:hypothetical protein
MDLGRLIDAARGLLEGKTDVGSLAESANLEGLTGGAGLEDLSAKAAELQDVAGAEGGLGEKAQAALDALRGGDVPGR